MGTAVAKRTVTAVRLKPIAAVVLQFKLRIWQGDDCRLEAAKLLHQLRERIEAGEEGDVSWWQWCEYNIERSRKDCEALLRLASAPNAEQALIEERERVRLAVAKHRAKKDAEVDAARLLLTSNGVEPKRRRISAAEKKAIERHEEQQAAIRAAWLRDHPARTPEDYEQILDSEEPGGDGPMWLWRRAMGRASIAAEKAAWLHDHPGNPLPEHMCSLTEEEGAAYDAWLETYEQPVISVPEGTYGLGLSAPVILDHILKESDPVSLALSLVEMMDAQQVRRLLVGIEEYQSQLARKKK